MSAVPNATDEAALRAEVRAFIAERVSGHGTVLECDSWLSGFDAEFSRALGERGWLGMTWPVEYGGGGRPERDRWIVNEELLAAGAPVAAHWFADRQSGPAILKHGTEEQRRSLLPALASGRCFVAIGMSEPDSGSDLASVRTTATRDDEGWVLRGTKIWTSHAHRAHVAIVLARTEPVTDGKRHAGLSQFLVDLSAPGVTVNPVRALTGEHHFNEVVFDDVRLSEGDLIGAAGQGWAQVTAELAYERSGSERFLSTMPLLIAAAEAVRGQEPSVDLGLLLAELVTLRAMSAEVAEALGRGEAPAVRAALVKDLGTRAEGRTIDVVRRLLPTEPDPASATDLQRHLVRSTLHAPGFTLRGGTNEILRGIVARTLPGSERAGGEARRTLESICERAMVHDRTGAWSEDDGRQLHKRLIADGWHRVGLSERLGGQGGDLRDAVDVAAGTVGMPSPLADVVLGGGHLLALAGLALPDEAELVVVAPAADAEFDSTTLRGHVERVPWASWSSHLLMPVRFGDGTAVALVATADAVLTPGRNLGGEPRDAVRIDAAPVAVAQVAQPLSEVLAACDLAGALTRCVQTSAALARILRMTAEHAAVRVQFGRPLAQFQAVQQLLAELAGEAAAAAAVTDRALPPPSPGHRTRPTSSRARRHGPPSRPAPARASRTSCTARSESAWSTGCTGTRLLCGHGGTSTAARRPGPAGSPRRWVPRTLQDCGRGWCARELRFWCCRSAQPARRPGSSPRTRGRSRRRAAARPDGTSGATSSRRPESRG